MLLNNDTTADPGFVEPLVAAASDSSVAAACSQILDESGRTIWYAGGDHDPRRGYQGRMWGHGEPPMPPDVAAYPTGRACGGAMLVRADVWREIGPLDDGLFAYVEDVEWSLRARRAGYEVLVVPASVVRHRVSAATGGVASALSLYYVVRNSIVVADRWAPVGRIGRARRDAVTVAAAAAQALSSRDRTSALRAVLIGWRDARRGVLGRKVPTWDRG
jgi:GT2 family glycosyltransferase